MEVRDEAFLLMARPKNCKSRSHVASLQTLRAQDIDEITCTAKHPEAISMRVRSHTMQTSP
jgi:hypothetical protein